MPRFYFHVRDGKEIIDDEGLELSGLDEAREQAVIGAGEAIRDLGKRFWNSGEEWHMDVTDESGATVCSLTFSSKR
jgi:hypothetical protein